MGRICCPRLPRVQFNNTATTAAVPPAFCRRSHPHMCRQPPPSAAPSCLRAELSLTDVAHPGSSLPLSYSLQPKEGPQRGQALRSVHRRRAPGLQAPLCCCPAGLPCRLPLPALPQPERSLCVRYSCCCCPATTLALALDPWPPGLQIWVLQRQSQWRLTQSMRQWKTCRSPALAALRRVLGTCAPRVRAPPSAAAAEPVSPLSNGPGAWGRASMPREHSPCTGLTPHVERENF